jgi:hypothetical protein
MAFFSHPRADPAEQGRWMAFQLRQCSSPRWGRDGRPCRPRFSIESRESPRLWRRFTRPVLVELAGRLARRDSAALNLPCAPPSRDHLAEAMAAEAPRRGRWSRSQQLAGESPRPSHAGGAGTHALRFVQHLSGVPAARTSKCPPSDASTVSRHKGIVLCEKPITNGTNVFIHSSRLLLQAPGGSHQGPPLSC